MGVNVSLMLIAIFNVAACSILGIVYSWKLGLAVVFGGLPPMLTAGWLKIRLDMKLDNNISKRNSGSASIASEAITAIRTVSSLAIEDHVLDRYTTELNHAVNGSVKPLAGVMICFAFTQAIEYWFMALGFWYVLSWYKSVRRTLIAHFKVRLSACCLQRNDPLQVLRRLHGRFPLRTRHRPAVRLLNQ